MNRNTVELLRGQITGLERQIAGLEKSGKSSTASSAVDSIHQLVGQLETKIAALEEYCLNVDHHNIPVPEKLQYLFTKTQGTYKWSNSTYTGELIRGKPSGVGKSVWDDGNTYEGQYVNGMKHGSVTLIQKSDGMKIEVTWKHDKEDGISKATFSDGTVVYGVFKDHIQQHVNKWIYPSGIHEYNNIKDGELHGHSIEYYTTEDYIVVYTYEAGEKQGKGKKYTYKEQVD